MNDIFQGQHRYRRAELITPPNVIKGKVGSGGLDASVIARAQQTLESAPMDFQPEAFALIDDLMQAVDDARHNRTTGDAAIENIMHPAMRLKGQAGMLQYPLVSEISNILINFLETINSIDDDSTEIVMAHRKALQAVLVGKMKGSGGKIGQELRDALMDACNRYYRKKSVV